MFKRDNGILSNKTNLNHIFWMFEENLMDFIDLFKIQIIFENANQIQEGNILSQEKLQDLSVTSIVIKKCYEAIFSKMNNDSQQVNLEVGKVNFRLINQLYDNITSFDQNELKDFISKVQILKGKYKIRFLERSSEIIYNCNKIINIINGGYCLYYKIMVEYANHLHQNIIKQILLIHQQKYQYFKMLDNFEFVQSQIFLFINIYCKEFDFHGFNLTQQPIILQYFELFLDNKLQKHQYVDLQNFQKLENVRDPNKIDQVLQIYSDNLREEFYMKFIQNNKITKNIRKQVKDVFKSQLVQKIMTDIQKSLNLPIDLSWDFLPYLSLIIIPNCNFKGFNLRNLGITINLTPFLDLYQQGFTDGYIDIMNAYCILVAINGWNCLQLIKKTQKSFYWYDDRIQNLNLEEFTFFKNLFGITKLEGNKQLFSLQYLNKETAKLILSIGEQQYTQDELHQLFKFQPYLQQCQPSIKLFQETIEEQLEIGIKLD